MPDYFAMMRDTLGSYADGVDQARARHAQDVRMDRERQEFEQRQRDWADTNTRRDETNAAIGGLRATSAGIYDGSQTNFSSLPPVSDAGPTPPTDAQPAGLRGPTPPSRRATPLEVNDAAQRVALSQRDMKAWSDLQEKGQTLHENELMGKAAKAPDDPALLQWINQNHKQISLGTPDKNGITPFSIVSPTGQAMFGMFSKADLAKLKGAAAIMEINPARAFDIIGAVNKDFAAALQTDNGTVMGVGNANNTGAFHSGSLNNQAMTARAAMATAGAAGLNARTNAEYHGELTKQVKQAAADSAKAREIASEFEDLTPAEQTGAKGLGLIRQFNILNVKPGGQISMGSAGNGKMPATLTDQEKLVYEKNVLPALDMLVNKYKGPDKVPAAEKAQVYQFYGLDPARFGVQGLPSWGAPAAGAGGLTVPGRPLYSADSRQLQVTATRPRGVSSAEASDAAEELRLRQGEARIGAR